MKRWLRSNSQIGFYRDIPYGIEDDGDQRYYFIDTDGVAHYADLEEELFAQLDSLLGSEEVMQPLPSVLKNKKFGFTLQGTNTTYNDDILYIVEQEGGIRYKCDTINPKTGQFYRGGGSWQYAVPNKETAEKILEVVKNHNIPLKTYEIINTHEIDWSKCYNIWIDNYQNGTKKLEYNRRSR